MSLQQSIDAVLEKGVTSYYDISFDELGDIKTEDFLDTSIIMSLLTDARATASEVPLSQDRRGWIGDEGTNFNSGSKIWLYSQARRDRATINGIENAGENCLEWMVDEEIALEVSATSSFTTTSGIGLNITLVRPNSEVFNRFYPLWENTGK